MEIRVEYMNFEEIAEWPRNPKDHDIDEIRKSFNRFGFVKPILVDEGSQQLVAGHGRLDALRKMRKAKHDPPRGVKIVGDKWLLPVLRGVKFEDTSEAEAYLLADNKLSEVGGWNNDALEDMLKDMKDISLEGTGFSSVDIDNILTSEKATKGIRKVHTTPYNRINVLVSFSPDLLHDLSTTFEYLKGKPGVRVYTSNNYQE